MLKYFFFLFTIACYGSCNFNEFSEEGQSVYSKERFFPLWGVIRIPTSSCNGTNDLRGTCYTRRECTRINGIQSGTCARNFGTCCIIQRSCDTTTNINCTYFVNPGYPRTYSGGSRCTITINKCNSNICQLRLDFLDFNLAQPDGNGNCVDDFLSITGSATTNAPRICGLNTNQHVYIDFNAGDTSSIQLSIDSNTLLAFARTWNIKISQIECTNPSLAPTGCLMYYTDLSGKVMSFNYANVPNNNPIPGTTDMILGTRELANLNYGVCVKMLPGYCSIEWSQNANDIYSFTVTDDTTFIATLGGIPLNNGNCTTDFIVIPNPSQNGMAVNTDRFCGTAFNTTTTSSKPFVMTVVTNDSEFPDVGNRGFCLNFRQIPCS